MKTKLTLTLDPALISKSKLYAKSQGSSLSNIVEEFLLRLTATENQFSEIKLTSGVKSLKGSVKVNDQDNFDHKQVLEDELTKKYIDF
ncbi:MAG: hypothetical protein H6581_10160 [Bacteroidia bacterium]|nr:hypothetical protein [Bacteroidia bacterium]